jgi:hypothetical protein
VISADDLDCSAFAPRPRIGDCDAVLRVADLSEPGELDLYSHG